MPKPHEKSPREKQLDALRESVADLIPHTPRVRVVPRDDSIRKGIVHPDGNLKFPEHTGSVEWPLDGFTQRRLRDGTVMLAADQKLDPIVEQLVPEAAKYGEHHAQTAHAGAPGAAASPQRPIGSDAHREHVARQAEIAAREEADHARAGRGRTPPGRT